MTKTVLISGSSVAGPALAYWLREAGFRPTVVEIAAGPRPGGQAIDIRGMALEVPRRMGILEAVYEKRMLTKGLSVLDVDGNEVSRTEELTLTGGRFDNEDLEILRDDLSQLLLDKTRKGVEYIYGDAITGMEQHESGVSVTFRNQQSRTFDFVVGADGLGSNVRRLTFGDDAKFLRPLGMCVTNFTTPNFLGLEDWQVAYWEGPARFIAYPARDNSELRVLVMFTAKPEDKLRGSIESQKALVAERCADLRWEMPRLLDAMRETGDFYFGVMAFVEMDTWSRGRVVLVGDAGYCPTPFSGQGTSLALVGAYVLGTELGRTPSDHADAFARYEARMRPYVKLNQALADRGHDDPLDEASLSLAKNAIDLDD